MESLRQQINPSLSRFASSDPDMTFRQYVESLIGQPITGNKGFSSAFVGAQSSKQPSTPTQSITEGMFKKYLNESGGDSSYGGDSNNNMGAPSSRGGLNSFASADDVVALDQARDFLGTTAGREGVGQLAGLLTGNPLVGLGASLLAQPFANFMGNQAFDSFNRGVDYSNQSFNDASMLGGLGTFSNAAGNVGTFSNQGLIDAYDMATFGTTGADLASSGSDSNSFGGDPNSPGGSPNEGGLGGFGGW